MTFCSHSSDGVTILDHEIEDYDSTNGDIVAWVKIPSLSSSVDTDIYMYYGCGTAENQENPPGVWSNGYEAVYHLHDDVNDSTTSHNGTDYNAPDPVHVDGQIADGHDYEENSSSYTDIGTWNVSGTEITIQAWVEIDTWANVDGRIVSKGIGTETDDHVWMLSTAFTSPNKRLRFRLKTGTLDGSGSDKLVATSGNLSEDTPYFVVAKYAGSDDTMRLRLCDNGTCSEVGSQTHTGSSTSHP